MSAEDLTEVLDSLFPGLNSVEEAKSSGTKQPTEVARELVVLTLERPDIVTSSDWLDLLVLIEVLLDKGAEPPWDEFAQSFLEDLLNAVSHGDLPIAREQVNEALGPASKRQVEYLDRVWVSMPGDEGPDVMDQAKFDSISSRDLKWIFRCMFRRTAEGTYVGTPDIVRREATTGRPGRLVT